MHDLPLPHSGHQEELKPESYFLFASLAELVQVFRFVHLWFRFRVTRPIILPDQSRKTIRLEERPHGFKLVVERSCRLLLFFTEESGEVQEMMSVDFVNVELVTGLSGVFERRRIGPRGSSAS